MWQYGASRVIDGTGEYIGRGPFCQPDSDFLKRMDAQSLARARVNALAGLGVPYHYRSNRTRQRPGDATADTANTPIALLMAPKATSYSDFTAQGMPVAVNAYRDPRTQGGSTDGHVYPDGGTGVWGPSGDSSHAVSYCYFMALVTGDEWLLEAQIDLVQNLAHQSIYGYNNFRQLMLTGQPQQAGATNPSTDTSYWSGLLGQWMPDNYRATGHSQLIIGQGIGIVPADHVAYSYLQAALAHNGDYIAGSLRNMPPDYVLAGAYYPPSELGLNSIGVPWQGFFQVYSAYICYLLTEDLRWKALGDHTANWPIRNAAAGRFYALDQYRTIDKLKNANWGTTNKMIPAEQQPFVQITPNLDASGVCTMGSVYWNAVSQNPPPFTNGDMVVFTSETQGGGNGTLPPGATEGQVAYIRDLTNPNATSGNVYATASPPYTTFKLASTPGGPALTNLTATNDINLAWLPQSIATFPAAQSYPYIPLNSNAYVPLGLVALFAARQAGNPAATKAMRDAAAAFKASMGPNTYSPLDVLVA